MDQHSLSVPTKSNFRLNKMPPEPNYLGGGGNSTISVLFPPFTHRVHTYSAPRRIFSKQYDRSHRVDILYQLFYLAKNSTPLESLFNVPTWHRVTSDSSSIWKSYLFHQDMFLLLRQYLRDVFCRNSRHTRNHSLKLNVLNLLIISTSSCEWHA